MPSRRDEYAAATRAAIVEAAIERFSSDGFVRTSVDAVADAARVTKGGVYHHFRDKAALFEAAFVAVEERLLVAIQTRVDGLEPGWALVEAGIDVYLSACREEGFRRIALEDAPVALGWQRWHELEERFFLGTATALLQDLRERGLIVVSGVDLAARLLLGALTEAGLAVAGAADPGAEQVLASALVLRFLRSLGEQPTAT